MNYLPIKEMSRGRGGLHNFDMNVPFSSLSVYNPFFSKNKYILKIFPLYIAESLIKVIAGRNVINNLSSRAGNNMVEIVRKFINTIILLYALIL